MSLLPRDDEWTDPGMMDPTPRRGRRLLFLLALLVVAVLVSFSIWCAMSPRGLPDVGEPFDIVSLGRIDIPDDENAFTYYRAASARLVGQAPSGIARPMTSWGAVPLDIKDWFFANSDAIMLWLEGTSRDKAVSYQPRDLRVNMHLDDAQVLRKFATLALIAGLRMEARGELDEAWNWYRAALRSSRHCGMNGLSVERMLGIDIYTTIDGAVRAWADQPNLTTESLRQALEEVLAINAMTPTFGQNLRADYFLYRSLLEDPQLSVGRLRQMFHSEQDEGRPAVTGGVGEAVLRLAHREPERSRRLLRLIFANWLSVGDLPAQERLRRMKMGAIGPWFDPPPGSPDAARLLTLEDQDDWVESSLYARLLFPVSDAKGKESLVRADAREATLRAGLVVHLAEELYRREHGEAPASPEQLVGKYLDALPPGYVSPSPSTRPTERPR
jgi:hypothetical protein